MSDHPTPWEPERRAAWNRWLDTKTGRNYDGGCGCFSCRKAVADFHAAFNAGERFLVTITTTPATEGEAP